MASIEIILDYFPDLSSGQQQQLQQLRPLYNNWNEKINLISRKDIHYLYPKHVLHSLSIAKVITFVPGTSILDVGTGGGFPGIPLAILFPKTKFHLIDSIKKKIHVVQHIANALDLSNVSTQQVRAEHVQDTYDFVLGRAVKNISTFYTWIAKNIKKRAKNSIPNGILYLQGNDSARVPIPGPSQTTYVLNNFFKEPFFATKQLVHIYN